jgi:hypothetical protein
LGYVAGAVLLPYLAYRAFWAHREGEETSLPIRAAVLAALVLVYVYRCIRRLRRRALGPRSWVSFLYLSLFVLTALIFSFTGIYRVVGINAPPGSPEAARGQAITRDAGDCLYFTIVTWTSLGYGDFSPTPAARPYAALEGIVGYVFMAFFIPTLIHATTATRAEAPVAGPPG